MDGVTGQRDQVEQMAPSTGEVIDAVRELITMMAKGGITELDLTTGDVTIRLRGSIASGGEAPPVAAAASGPARPQEAAPSGHVVTAPMIGTYYAAPAPGEPPFVQVGDEVEAGQVIGIIEAMKIMNEIVSDRSGMVTEILVENAQPVEYGQPLLRLAESMDGLG